MSQSRDFITIGPDGRPVGDLSDAELEEELERRRRKRGAMVAAERPHAKGRRTPSRRIVQFYANLELSEDASLEEVRSAYGRLMERYHPDRHANDPERHRAATKLAAQLTEAYEALLEHLQSSGR